MPVVLKTDFERRDNALQRGIRLITEIEVPVELKEKQQLTVKVLVRPEEKSDCSTLEPSKNSDAHHD